MKYIVFGPMMSDEEFDKKIAEDEKKIEEMERNLEEVSRHARELLKK